VKPPPVPLPHPAPDDDGAPVLELAKVETMRVTCSDPQ
jgi:hypothetical protein